MECLWSADLGENFRPDLKDVLGFYTHPFPSTIGNRRSFIQVADLKRIPQNGVAPFRMESQGQIEVKWSKMSSRSLVAFVGKFFTNTRV